MTAITEFLRRQKETDSPHRRVQRQKKWLDAVEGLLRHIRSWLAEAQREKLGKIHPDKIKITEENLGTYTAPYLVLTAAGKTVNVDEKGSGLAIIHRPAPPASTGDSRWHSGRRDAWQSLPTDSRAGDRRHG